VRLKKDCGGYTSVSALSLPPAKLERIQTMDTIDAQTEDASLTLLAEEAELADIE